MFLSRSKGNKPVQGAAGGLAVGPSGSAVKRSPVSSARTKIPTLQEFLERRDFTGVVSILQYWKGAGKVSPENDMWLGYGFFHMGDFEKAVETYESILTSQYEPLKEEEKDEKRLGFPSMSRFRSKDGKVILPTEEINLNISCCKFFLGLYDEATEFVSKVPSSSPLKNRLELHLAHKSNDESVRDKLTKDSPILNQENVEDQLCLASIHYLKGKYQEAIDIYKKILIQNREFTAVNVYIALCYYKLDYYDVSQEVLTVYLKSTPDSALAVNLRACNHYRLYNGKAAETELRALIESSSNFNFGKELVRHNLVVFKGGEGALSVLPGLLDILPEARLNLVIYHLKNKEISKAYELIKDTTPSMTNEYIVKGIVNAMMGQETGSRDQVKQAQQYFQVIGGSSSECDTIPGRQCMASCFFLMRQFDDVILYLSSIKSYFYNDDNFSFNYAQAKAATGKFTEAEELFKVIQDEEIKEDPVYVTWFVHCLIMNKKVEEAWIIYQKMENSSTAFDVLTLIANDCYQIELYLDSLKGFDLLEKLDQNPEYWEGKRGAAAGQFEAVVSSKQDMSTLNEVIRLLRTSKNTQSEQMVNVMKKWMKEKESNK